MKEVKKLKGELKKSREEMKELKGDIKDIKELLMARVKEQEEEEKKEEEPQQEPVAEEEKKEEGEKKEEDATKGVVIADIENEATNDFYGYVIEGSSKGVSLWKENAMGTKKSTK